MKKFEELLDQFRTGPNEEVLSEALKACIDRLDTLAFLADTMNPIGVRFLVVDVQRRVHSILEKAAAK